MIPTLLLTRIYYDIQILKEREYLAVWGSFYDEFKNNDIYTSCYYVIFFLRRMLLTFSFEFLYKNPFMQILIVIGSCWLVSTYLLIFQPYKTRFNNIFQIINECTISLGYTLTGLLYFKDKVDSTIINWMILSLIYISYLNHLVISMSSLLTIILRWITDKCASKIDKGNQVSHNDVIIQFD
jgi:hypothetical protein